METDIMNEILTLTVSSLFSFKLSKSMSKKGSYTSQLSELASETSESQLIQEMKSKFIVDDVAQEEDKEDFDGVKLDPSSSKNLSLGCMDLETWINVEGPKRLKQSFSKLKLDNTKVQRKDFTSFIEDELVQEKKNVKNELKYYDNAFITVFGKAPGRADKEPMRPLYMYYQNLRKAITKKAYAKGGPSSKASAGVETRAQSVGAASNNDSKISFGSFGGSEDDKKSKPSLLPFTEEDSKDKPPEDLMKKLGLKDEKDLKKQIHEYMKERKHLRKVLDAFQKDFQKTYNRKLRFTKDIVPVASEFKRYKELKKEIAKLENLMNNLKKSK